MTCKWCKKGMPKYAIDVDGILCSLTGNPERFQHAADIYYWKCEDGSVGKKKTRTKFKPGDIVRFKNKFKGKYVLVDYDRVNKEWYLKPVSKKSLLKFDGYAKSKDIIKE